MLFKKLVPLTLAAVLAIGSFTACGGSTPAPAPADPAAPADSAAAPADSGKEIVINFSSIWVGADSKAPVMKELTDQFNAENAGKIKVVVEEMSDYQAYRDKIKTSIATGMPPDIFSLDFNADLPSFFGTGKLMDLSAAMEAGWKDTFVPGQLQYGQLDGKQFAIPFEFAVTPILYNTEIIKSVGYDSFPKTYPEMIEMFKKLKDKGIIAAPQMTGENAFTTMLWYSQLVQQVGGKDIWTKDLSDPAFVEAAKLLKEMFDYANGDAVGAGAAITAGHFLNERSATLENGTWFIGRIKKEGVNNLFDKVNVAPFPTVPGGKGEEGAYIGFIQALIGAAKQDDPAKEAAVIKYLQHITSPENVKKLSLSAGSMFSIQFDLAEGEQDRVHTMMVEQRDAAPYVVPHFQASVPIAVLNEFPQAVSGLAAGQLTPEQFMEQLISVSQQ